MDIKKLAFLSIVLFSAPLYAVDDFSMKRRLLAIEVIKNATAITEGINRLNQIKDEVQQCGGGFSPSDFASIPANQILPVYPGLIHVNDWNMNNLVNIIAPSLKNHLQTVLENTTTKYIDILNTVKN